MLATEHLLDLGGLDLGLEVVERRREIAANILALGGPFDQDVKVVVPPLERQREVVILLETSTTTEYLLGSLGVVPKPGVRSALFELSDFITWAGCVKDDSAGQRPAGRDPDSVEPVHRV